MMFLEKHVHANSTVKIGNDDVMGKDDRRRGGGGVTT